MKLADALKLEGTPLYSVVCATYNHARFLNQAINGVFMQEVDGPTEVLVIDDFSNDGTSEMLRSLSEAYKNFHHLRNTKNLFGTSQHALNMEETINRKTLGEFIFYLELDDVWVDPWKMRKQADCLRSYPDASFCFHEFVQVDEGGFRLPFVFPIIAKKDYTKKELLEFSYAYILLSTCAFRRTDIPWPKELYVTRNGDMFLPAYYGQMGRGKFLENIEPHHYRIHSGGLWSGASESEKRKMKLETALMMLHFSLRNDNLSAFASTLNGRFLAALNALFSKTD